MARRRSQDPDPAPGFPLRVGVVDMGSNAIRLVAAEFIAPATYTELLSDRVPIRLGHGVYETGRLEENAIEGAVRAMVRFREVLDEFEISHYRAVATSAVRESENGRQLVRRIRKEADLELDVITGVEEARLVVGALAKRMNLGQEPWVLADLGGGSLEVALVNDTGMIEAESHTIGSVRLHEEFEDAAGDLRRFRKLLDEYLAALRLPAFQRDRRPAGFMATGGNMEDLAVLAKARREDSGVSVVDLQNLDAVIERLARLTYEQRIEKLGLRPDRADVILPAAMVYARLARIFQAKAIRVPHVGVKEGVMYDLVDGLVAHAGYSQRHQREVLAGAVALGRRFGFDESHGVHVARLAEVLYDQLASLHDLDGAGREILLAAAVLHDIGQSISYTKHHKHSQYLIAQSELPGFQPSEILLIATIARYHRKAHPSDKHEEFATLEADDKQLVARLAAILRVADALDREHQEKVKRVAAAIRDGVVHLELEGEGDLALERWAVGRKAELFEKTFDRKLEVGGENGDQEDEDNEVE
jgi:exopolyphosphatase/guanosine-5'-triphosphate,3'-diphosphate pyrophosphatase